MALSESDIRSLVDDADRARLDAANRRAEELDYYDGERPKPASKHRSKAISNDLRKALRDLLPAIKDTFFGGEKFVSLTAGRAEDVDGVRLLEDFTNHVAIDDAAEDEIADAIFDSFFPGGGWLTWRMEDDEEAEHERFVGLSDDEIAVLGADGWAVQSDEGDGDGRVVVLVRYRNERRPVLEAVPPEEMLYIGGKRLDKATLIGRFTTYTRSELREFGWVPDEVIDSVPEAGTARLSERPDDYDRSQSDDVKESQKVDFWDLYFREVKNGRAVYRRVVFVGDIVDEYKVKDEPVIERPFAHVVAERVPHTHKARSMGQDVLNTSNINTALLRQSLDNLYWANNPRPIVNVQRLKQPDDLFTDKFGAPIRVEGEPSGVVSWYAAPVVIGHAIAMMDKVSGLSEQTTGASDASAGLALDALQNATAKAVAVAETSAVRIVKEYARSIARGLSEAMHGFVAMIARYSSGEYTVDAERTFDMSAFRMPKSVKVNVGLGGGSRERDMQALLTVQTLMDKLSAVLGPDNPFYGPDEVANLVEDITRVAGVSSPRRYFRRPSEEEIAAHKERMASAPSPEQYKIMLEQEKAKTAAAREAAQLEADLKLAEAKLTNELELKRAELAMRERLEAMRMERDVAIERERGRVKLEIERIRRGEDDDAEADALIAELGSEIEEEIAREAAE